VLGFKGSPNLRRIVVLNPKGGSGKTTLASNVAGYLATTGRVVALVDMDRQGSSMRWLQNRPPELPEVRGIAAAGVCMRQGTECNVAVPTDCEIAVIDAPAGLTGEQLIDFTCGAHAILVPVLPSDLDIHAASRLVSELLLVAQVSRRNGRLGIVANRVKEHTVAYRQLSKFLGRLNIAVAGVLRDSQNYAWAAASGLCIHELAPSRSGRDIEQWNAVTGWLEERLRTPLTARDLRRPGTSDTAVAGSGRRPGKLLAAAAAVAAIAVSVAITSSIPHRNPAVTTSMLSMPVGNELTAEELAVEAPPVAPDSHAALPVSDDLIDRWQLRGIVRMGESKVLMLNDRINDSSRRVASGEIVDGWRVSDVGNNYAVFTQDGQEVRLMLSRANVGN